MDHHFVHPLGVQAVEEKEQFGIDGGEGGHNDEIWRKNSYFVVIRLGVQKIPTFAHQLD